MMSSTAPRRRGTLPECASEGCPCRVGEGRPPAVLLYKSRLTLLCGSCAQIVAAAVPYIGMAGGELNGEFQRLHVFSLDVIDPELLPRA